jgi:hypothetical protein
MRGDAVGARLDRGQRGAYRIRPLAASRVAQGRDVIDIYTEAQRRNGHFLDSQNSVGLSLILRSAKRVSKDESHQPGRMVRDGASRLLTMRIGGGVQTSTH